MRYAAAVDENQPAIVAALRKRGHKVRHIHRQGGGVGDLLVGARRKLSRLLVVLEVKRARNKAGDLEPLTPAEAEFHGEFEGWPVYVVGTVEQAIAVVEGA